MGPVYRDLQGNLYQANANGTDMDYAPVGGGTATVPIVNPYPATDWVIAEGVASVSSVIVNPDGTLAQKD